MVKLKRELCQLVVTSLLVCFALPLTAAAADFWIKKPYQTWSADETRRMLEESPWATTLSIGGVQTNVTTHDSPNNTGYRGEMESNPSITYTLQFRSARPIREAQVRSSQLGAHYDKMTAEQKAAFDANAGKFLTVTFPDRVVVSVSFRSNIEDYVAALHSYWASETMPKLSMTVFLNTNTERLSLLNYTFKDDTFQFTFPRPKQLRPDEKVGVEFVHPRINVIGQQRVLQEFSVKKMLVDGESSF